MSALAVNHSPQKRGGIQLGERNGLAADEGENVSALVSRRIIFFKLLYLDP